MNRAARLRRRLSVGKAYKLPDTTGSVITALDIAYTGEQWRLGTPGRIDRLDFQFSVDASSLTAGTYIDFDALDFATPNALGAAGAYDGNAGSNSTALGASITGLNIANNASFWLRWTDFNASSNDDGLAIDNFSLTGRGVILAQPLAVPEPGSLVLAGVALLALATARRPRCN